MDARPLEAAEPSDAQPLLACDQGNLDKQGLGPDGAMLLPKHGGEQVFNDRCLVRRLLMTGKSATSVNHIVDNYSAHFKDGTGESRKRRKVRPAKRDVVRVLEAAFAQYPRLGSFTAGGGQREVVLKGWSESEQGQILYHNELMRCCGVSLRDLSKKRASYYDANPVVSAGDGAHGDGGGLHGLPVGVAEGAPESGGADAAWERQAAAAPQFTSSENPSTPPGGHVSA